MKEYQLYNKLMTILVLMILLIGQLAPVKLENSLEFSTLIEDEILDTLVYHYVTATEYHAVESQCDSDPLITACNAKIDLNKLNKGDLKWIAVSRDLLEEYPYGSKVMIESDNDYVSGIWYVMDTMHKRWTKRIDLLVPESTKFQFGKLDNVKLTKLQ